MLCADCQKHPAVTPDGRCRICSVADAETASAQGRLPQPEGFGEAPTTFDTPRDGRTTPYYGAVPQQPVPPPGMPPYGAGMAPYGAQPPYGYPAPPLFRGLGGLSVALYALLGLTIAADVFSLAVGGQMHGLMDRIDTASDSEIDSTDAMYALTGVLQLGALIATGVVFIVWFHRSRKNAEAFNTGVLRHTAGWSIGAWFIPLANFVIPKKIANDVWQASTPPPPAGTWQAAKIGLVTGWWALFVIDSVFARLASGQYNDADLPDELKDAVGAMMISDVLNIAAAILCILYVRKLTAMQDIRHTLLMTSAGAPGYPIPGAVPQQPYPQQSYPEQPNLQSGADPAGGAPRPGPYT